MRVKQWGTPLLGARKLPMRLLQIQRGVLAQTLKPIRLLLDQPGDSRKKLMSPGEVAGGICAPALGQQAFRDFFMHKTIGLFAACLSRSEESLLF